MNEFKCICGARLGWFNASWPLAFLSVNSKKLKLRVLIFKNYEFVPDQVLSVKKYVFIPIFGWGVQVQHTVNDYPERIIIWSLYNPQKIIDKISEVGFLNKS
ncbi:hypothetical protein DOM21_03720 [Bacteriovorax stolpii]|uniref:hypothetical protein n=1 Tax=Bacteriovorax stolpii TaxID=960 RepID=UPI001157AE8A|nr:hypothetical protein [Bacteriovorax stolpii]QDK40574.1 hypothetical protein DOM21_03720 [Bacteriovorax stolpii]